MPHLRIESQVSRSGIEGQMRFVQAGLRTTAHSTQQQHTGGDDVSAHPLGQHAPRSAKAGWDGESECRYGPARSCVGRMRERGEHNVVLRGRRQLAANSARVPLREK